MNGWFSAVCALLEPLYDTLVARVIGSDYVQADETPIPVMDRKKHKATHRGYFWVYHAPESGGVVFDYREGRGRAGPKEFLDRFGGILQTDGYAAYNEVGAREDIVHVGCMAHIRRKFFEAKDNDQARADEALARIGELYDIERRCREQGLHAEERLALRELEARPLMVQFKTWMEAQLTDTLPKSAIGKALHYALAQWPRMVRYLEDGRIEIDNNRIENQIRPVALGRKNYLFCGSHEGARRAAMIYSLLGTCKMNGVEPFAWLREVLTRIPDHPVNRLAELLPGRLR